jgi:hypothetical protein
MRSSEASAMMPSCDQSRASIHEGQHLSSVTSVMLTYSMQKRVWVGW